MTAHITKIGLIQNAPLPGDFSANLRHIVQGYRDCLDHGAQLVIAPAAALCGLEPRSLTGRSSFMKQMRAAMVTLSRELGSAPLLLGGYSDVIAEEELWEAGENDYYDTAADPDSAVVPVPYLLEHDSVTELEDGEITDILGTSVYVTIGDEEMLPDGPNLDMMVQLSTAPWYTGAEQKEADACSWQARVNQAVFISSHATGTAGQRLFSGGSAVYGKDGSVLSRLPFFETAAKVVNLSARYAAEPLPDSVDMLRMALERGLRDTVRNNGYSGVCVPQDAPNSTLLTALAVSALGSGNVCGISFKGQTAATECLHTDSLTPDASGLTAAANAIFRREEAGAALTARMETLLMLTLAEERGMMLLSPLDRSSLMTGHFSLYGESGGHLAPLANLYRIDIYMLSKRFSEQHPDLFGSLEEPARPEQDRIIHELADRNISPSELLSNNGMLFKENDVRLIQRQMIASELKRTQLPVVLHVDAPEQQHRFPISHRLND